MKKLHIRTFAGSSVRNFVLIILFELYGSEAGCGVINFEINLVFQIKPFFYMTKKSRQKFKYLENKTSF